MIELRPCPACARHVAVHEVACPFCAVALAPGSARRVVLRGRLTRAAVFGAALAAGACGKSDAPAPVHEGSSDPKELERVLDEPFAGSGHAVVPSDAAPDATAIAAIDAGVPPDAAVDADAIARREAERKRREAERRRHLEEEQERLRQQQQQLDWQHHNAKPYGAPPARRRVV